MRDWICPDSQGREWIARACARPSGLEAHRCGAVVASDGTLFEGYRRGDLMFVRLTTRDGASGWAQVWGPDQPHQHTTIYTTGTIIFTW